MTASNPLLKTLCDCKLGCCHLQSHKVLLYRSLVFWIVYATVVSLMTKVCDDLFAVVAFVLTFKMLVVTVWKQVIT